MSQYVCNVRIIVEKNKNEGHIGRHQKELVVYYYSSK